MSCKLRDFTIVVDVSVLTFTIGDSSFSILAIAMCLPCSMFITQQYWLPPCSAHTYNVRCHTSIGLQLNWINSSSVAIMAFNWIIVIILFFGREKSTKLAPLTLVRLARARTHINSWDIFIYSLLWWQQKMKVSHDEKYSAVAATTVAVSHPLSTVCIFDSIFRACVRK